MSEKIARRTRKTQASHPAEQPESAPTATVADLFQLLGTKDVEILGLQRQVVGLQQQVQMLSKRLARGKKATT